MVAYLLNSWLNRDIMENLANRPVERSSLDTRIEFPDMSYEHELLNTPVPFSNRVEFLSDSVKLSPKIQTAQAIANELEVTVANVVAMAKMIDATPKVSDAGLIEYDPYTLEVIQEELNWQKSFDSLDEYLSIPNTANYLGKSKDWVLTHAAGLDEYPAYRPLNTARPVQSYPKSVVYSLRTISLHFPPANGLLNIAEVEDVVGKSYTWINKMVAVNNLPTSMRTTTATKRVGVHFYEETVNELKKIADELPEPAGGYYTAHHIGALLGKSDRWINARLIPYMSFGEELLDDFSRPAIHYPQAVFELLKEASLEVPPADGWFTNYDIQRILGVGIDWLNNRLKSYQNVAETRLSIASRPAPHYPPEVVEEIEELAHSYYGRY